MVTVELGQAAADVRSSQGIDELALAVHGTAHLLTALRMAAIAHGVAAPPEVALASMALKTWALDLDTLATNPDL